MCTVADNNSADEVIEEQEPDYRFTLANERTFLAWQRTALGLLAAAVALVNFVPELVVVGARRVMGVGLAALAISTSWTGLQRWRLAERAMRRGQPLPRHPSPDLLAVGLISLGVITLAMVIAKVAMG
ncbi:YidH family protein [Mycobacterium sp. ML4]